MWNVTLYADLILVIPCDKIDPDSWRWITSGCFLFNNKIVDLIFWLVVGALLMRGIWLHQKGRHGLAS